MKMMKRIFLITLGCMMCGIMKAQHLPLFDEYIQEAGDHAEMFSGKIESGYPSTMYLNSPYIPFDEFSTGDVIYNGLMYRKVLLRYDAYLKQLVVNTPGRHLNVSVPMSYVEKFTLEGKEYERRNGEMVAILFSSPRMELMEQVNISVKEEMVTHASLKYRFERDVKYYILQNGKTHEVDKLKSVLKFYPDIKKELRRFAKMHHLNFKEHRQSSLVSMIKYADELLMKHLN